MEARLNRQAITFSVATRLALWWELSKPGIVLLALVMATLGFALGTSAASIAFDLRAFFSMLMGLGLIGASACALNQYLEQDIDKKMARTESRPLPSGRMAPEQVLAFGFATGIVGEAILLFAVNPMTAVLGALTVLFYLGIYTVAKKQTSLGTLVGAVPGALPPLMGWTAAYGALSQEGLLLFWILFLWQIPHFLAIAWIYREDYARAGVPVLPVIDLAGRDTAYQVILYTLALVVLTLFPYHWRIVGSVYLWGSLLLGGLFFICGALFSRCPSLVTARALFWASLLYLPLLGALMVWDRMPLN